MQKPSNKHDLSGDCKKCDEIFDKYPRFHIGMRIWFKQFQSRHPEAHISCAGRGKADQEAAFVGKVSKAKWTQSAHNWNVAFDIFELLGKDVKNIFEQDWYDDVLAPELPNDVEWYGKPGSKFFELPHVELKDWRRQAQDGWLNLVE